MTTPASLGAVARAFVRLRWRLLRASARGRGAEKAGVVVSTVASVVVGVGVGAAVAVAGRSTTRGDELFVLLACVLVLGVAAVSLVAGATQPIDPRVIATEPLSDVHRSVGLLVATAAGPPGLAGALVGAGLVIGAVREPASLPPALLAVAALLATLLLTSRVTVGALGLLATRRPRLGQLVVALGGLVFYGGVQFVPSVIASLDAADRRTLTDVLALTPPGQLGRALATAGASAPVATLHALGGASIVPALVVAHLVLTQRLTRAVALADRARPADGRRRAIVAGAVRRACGRGPAGALAWRNVLTRVRTPRTAIETCTGAGIGMAAILLPALLRDDPGGGAVLVGGGVQLAVLFLAGNTLGNTGPALTWEILTGADGDVLARGTARSIMVVAAPLAVLGPIVAAAVTGAWSYLPAGLLVGVGGLLAGTGGAMVQSTIVPVAVPESDNPFASGESGRGIVAALLLGAVLAGLAVATLPVALALLWATNQGSVPLVTVLGACAVAAGALVLRAGVRTCARRLRDDAPALLAAVTPAR
jgi:ABC-2 type transport system permease protein